MRAGLAPGAEDTRTPHALGVRGLLVPSGPNSMPNPPPPSYATHRTQPTDLEERKEANVDDVSTHEHHPPEHSPG